VFLLLLKHTLLLPKLAGDVVQVVPSYSSVAPVTGGPPPKAKAAVCIPAPAKACLAVFKPVGFEVQVEPSYSSVAVVTEVEYYLQKLKLLFECPQPAKYFLLYLNFRDLKSK
jgi:hypothetical protein